MTSINFLEYVVPASTVRELVFAGDGVRLAGQIEYPDRPVPSNGYPLVFILHHAGCEARDHYQHYAELALESGYAVFRWDKRGTGRSGAGGRGSTTQDAVNAYEMALDQPDINHRRVIILAQGAGTGLIGSSFGLFARIQRPCAVILAANMLDEQAVLAIDTHVHIIIGQEDWNPWQLYGRAAALAHKATYKYGASYYAAPSADRMLMDPRQDPPAFHYGAASAIRKWLGEHWQPSASI